MELFTRKNDELFAEEVAVAEIAKEVGTPCYIYSRAALLHSYAAYEAGFRGTDHIVCYSVKANSNLTVLRTLADAGCGFDVVSGGELERVIRAGGDPQRVVFSGVGKQEWEIQAALTAGILLFNVESTAELELIDRVAGKMGKRARVGLRINPDVDPNTHPYIATGLKTSKFGIAMQDCMEGYARARSMAALDVFGIDCHIGSQLTSIAPFLEALERLMGLISRLRDSGARIRYLDMGGGLGISYEEESPPTAGEYARSLARAIVEADLTLLVEPGRSIAGNAGILVTKVLFHKDNHEKSFVIVDAAMNDLMRPALYSARHRIEPVGPQRGTCMADVVGPICETGDFLARDRAVPVAQPGDLLAVMSAGAYGFTMASNYNTRGRAPEVLVDGSRFFVVRRRETVDDLLSCESIPEGMSRRD